MGSKHRPVRWWRDPEAEREQWLAAIRPPELPPELPPARRIRRNRFAWLVRRLFNRQQGDRK